jgi:hypothetical protein
VPHGIFQSIKGTSGAVEIPTLGAKIATISNWSLILRPGDGGLYDFRAEFSYINHALWEDDDYTKQIIVTLGRRKQFRVQKASDEETVLVGRSLLMKGVTLNGTEA